MKTKIIKRKVRGKFRSLTNADRSRRAVRNVRRERDPIIKKVPSE